MRTLVLALVLMVPFFAASADPRSSQASYRIIVHPSSTLTTVERRFLSDAFLKKVTRWPNGEVIRAVDLGPSSSVRQKFSEEVLSRSVEAIKNYWQQTIFSGRDVPPPEVDSDEDVVRHVLKYRGSVGYISGGADPGGAKTIVVR